MPPRAARTAAHRGMHIIIEQGDQLLTADPLKHYNADSL